MADVPRALLRLPRVRGPVARRAHEIARGGRRRLPARQARGARAHADAARGQGARARARPAGRAADEAADGRVRGVGARAERRRRARRRVRAHPPRDVLDGPRLGCVNVHASLLPKYRGAAPITWAVVRGETRDRRDADEARRGHGHRARRSRAWRRPSAPTRRPASWASGSRASARDAVREWLRRYVAGDVAARAAGRRARRRSRRCSRRRTGASTGRMSARAGARPRARHEPVARRVHDGARQAPEGARDARLAGGRGERSAARDRRPRASAGGRSSSRTSRACSWPAAPGAPWSS